MSDNKNYNKQDENQKEQFSLNDDRRVKTLSPGALVMKRFFRNRLAVLGLAMLAVMFIFSFIGGMISPTGRMNSFTHTPSLKRNMWQ